MYLMRISTLAPYLFLLINCVISLQFPGSIDQIIRKSLLSALKRFHKNDPAPRIYKPKFCSFHLIKLEHLSHDVLSQTVGKFLDFKSIVTLRKASINTREISNFIVKIRLASFCPYFVFDGAFLNDLLLFVIDEHFPESSNLNSPSIKDELQVLILKFNFGELNYEIMPRNIYFYLIAFINEFIYGANSTVQVTRELCLFDSIRSIIKYNFPRTFAYLKTLQSTDFPDEYIRNLEFFSTDPSKEDVRLFFGVYDFTLWRKCPIMGSFELIIYDYFVDEDISTDDLVLLCRFLEHHFWHYSSAVMDRISSDLKENKWNMLNTRCLNFSFDSMYSICERYPDSTPDCALILKRVIRDMPLESPNEVSEPSDIEGIISLFKYFEGRSNLYQIDLFSQCINSPHLTVERRSFHLRLIQYHLNTLFFDVSLKENPRPFNMFSIDPYSHTLFPVYSFAKVNHDIMSTFFDQLNSRDPIVLLFMFSANSLLAIKQYILSNFDLNRTYRFDFGGLELVSPYNIMPLAGRTLHFKQIIKELREPKLLKIFSSNPREFDNDFAPNEPVISINPNMGAEYF
jgi:hypothetical protein